AVHSTNIFINYTADKDNKVFLIDNEQSINNCRISDCPQKTMRIPAAGRSTAYCPSRKRPQKFRSVCIEGAYTGLADLTSQCSVQILLPHFAPKCRWKIKEKTADND
ncbi:hypothetical protein, partial [Phocaeicola salanitronis]|uniref:hypothetical protein n=1 Tax=Phocaeicola salanitronis TaxID=376805 RepID=UPI0023F906EB